MAKKWIAPIHASKVSPDHADRTLVRFEQDAFPWTARGRSKAIDAPELMTVLRRVTSRSVIETAHHLRFSLAQVFRYAIATGQCATINRNCRALTTTKVQGRRISPTDVTDQTTVRMCADAQSAAGRIATLAD